MVSVIAKCPMPTTVCDDASQGPYILHTTTGDDEGSLRGSVTSRSATSLTAKKGPGYALACLRLARIASSAPVVGSCCDERSAAASALEALSYACVDAA